MAIRKFMEELYHMAYFPLCGMIAGMNSARPADLVILPASKFDDAGQLHWYPWLEGQLENKGLSVLRPDFPGGNEQTRDGWMSTLERHASVITERTIMAGHSLGGRLLLEWLESHRVGAAVFVAAPYAYEPVLWQPVANRPDAPTGFWPYSPQWKRMRKNARFFRLFYGDNDKLISPQQPETLCRRLGVSVTWIPGGGHLDENSHYAEFPLLAAHIETLHRSLAYTAPEGNPGQRERSW